MTGISVTTKHEKIYANPLFAVSYGSFQGRPLHSKTPRLECCQCITALLEQLLVLLVFHSRPLRVPPVLRHGLPDALNACWRIRACTEPAVEPAPSILHRRTLARRTAPVLRPAARCLREVSRRIPILQPSAPLLMEYSLNFTEPTPPHYPPLPQT
jgi:hypothetical protein